MSIFQVVVAIAGAILLFFAVTISGVAISMKVMDLIRRNGFDSSGLRYWLSWIVYMTGCFWSLGAGVLVAMGFIALVLP